jgi:hypothetical protein
MFYAVVSFISKQTGRFTKEYQPLEVSQYEELQRFCQWYN